MSTPIHHVSDPALWVATYRAEESDRADALFRDPLAAKLAEEKGREISKNVYGSIYTRWNVVMRTCVIDRFIKEQVSAGVDLVVNLGAGLDTRPYRMDLPPSLRWVEVDFPHMVQFKNDALAGEKPLVRLERHAVDLSDDSARRTILDDLARSSQKILVITEGVIPYLTNEQAAALARDLRARPSFRYWVVDYVSPQVRKYMQKKKFREQFKNAPFQFQPNDWHSFYKNLGWKVKTMRFLSEESLSVGRPIPAPFWFRIVKLLLTKAKREELTRYTAYTLLEPM
jgi:methyltransferase (TIGR00027 family)